MTSSHYNRQKATSGFPPFSTRSESPLSGGVAATPANGELRARRRRQQATQRGHLKHRQWCNSGQSEWPYAASAVPRHGHFGRPIRQAAREMGGGQHAQLSQSANAKRRIQSATSCTSLIASNTAWVSDGVDMAIA